MGLYDTVFCRVPLPVDGANAHSFQTKCLPDPDLSTLEIRADGTLWLRKWLEPDWNFFKFLGTLRFYSYEDGKWLEFAADFIYGVLVPGTLRVVKSGDFHESD